MVTICHITGSPKLQLFQEDGHIATLATVHISGNCSSENTRIESEVGMTAILLIHARTRLLLPGKGHEILAKNSAGPTRGQHFGWPWVPLPNRWTCSSFRSDLCPRMRRSALGNLSHRHHKSLMPRNGLPLPGLSMEDLSPSFSMPPDKWADDKAGAACAGCSEIDYCTDAPWGGQGAHCPRCGVIPGLQPGPHSYPGPSVRDGPSCLHTDKRDV